MSSRSTLPTRASPFIEELDAAALDEFQSDTGINLRRQAKGLRRFLDVALQAMEKEALVVKETTWPGSHSTIEQIVKLSRRHARMLHDWLS